MIYIASYRETLSSHLFIIAISLLPEEEVVQLGVPVNQGLQGHQLRLLLQQLYYFQVFSAAKE